MIPKVDLRVGEMQFRFCNLFSFSKITLLRGIKIQQICLVKTYDGPFTKYIFYFRKCHYQRQWTSSQTLLQPHQDHRQPRLVPTVFSQPVYRVRGVRRVLVPCYLTVVNLSDYYKEMDSSLFDVNGDLNQILLLECCI